MFASFFVCLDNYMIRFYDFFFNKILIFNDFDIGAKIFSIALLMVLLWEGSKFPLKKKFLIFRPKRSIVPIWTNPVR